MFKLCCNWVQHILLFFYYLFGWADGKRGIISGDLARYHLSCHCSGVYLEVMCICRKAKCIPCSSVIVGRFLILASNTYFVLTWWIWKKLFLVASWLLLGGESCMILSTGCLTRAARRTSCWTRAEEEVGCPDRATEEVGCPARAAKEVGCLAVMPEGLTPWLVCQYDLPPGQSCW